MIEQLIKNVKVELGSKLFSLGLPESKVNGAIKLATESVQSKLSGQISGGNIAGLTSLFSGKPPLDQSSLVKSMIAENASKMVSKLGVSESISQTISSFLITFILSKLSNQVAGGGDKAIMQLVGKSNTLNKIKSISNIFKSIL